MENIRMGHQNDESSSVTRKVDLLILELYGWGPITTQVEEWLTGLGETRSVALARRCRCFNEADRRILHLARTSGFRSLSSDVTLSDPYSRDML